jgi:hypothetical protein
MTQHIDYINSKQTDFYGFDILTDRKEKKYDKNNLEKLWLSESPPWKIWE